MKILEFNLKKQLQSAWGTSYYNEQVKLALSFASKDSPCFEYVKEISLTFYKKGTTNISNIILEFEPIHFAQQNLNYWTGLINFSGDKLLNYIHENNDDIAYLDGQFTFVMTNNEIIKSNLFYCKVLHSDVPTPPENNYPTLTDVMALINKHNDDKTSHYNVVNELAKCIKSGQDNELIGSLQVTNKPEHDNDVVRKIDLDNHTVIRKFSNIITDEIKNTGIFEINGYTNLISVYIDNDIIFPQYIIDYENKKITVKLFDSSETTFDKVYGNINNKRLSYKVTL